MMGTQCVANSRLVLFGRYRSKGSLCPYQGLESSRHERHGSFSSLARRAAQYALSIVSLGSHSNVVSMAARKIKEGWKQIEIVGYRDGYFSSDQIPLIRDEVQRARPTLLLIGLGSPRQEEVALEFLQVPDLQIVWTVGGLFDFLSGRIKRAPHVVRMLPCEWLFRICLEPRRLTLRYLFDALWLARACAYEWLIKLKLK